MKKPLYILYIIACAITISSCKDNPSKINPLSVDNITGIKWKLIYISENDFGITAPPIDSLYTISFSANGEFEVKDFCNSCSGGFELENGIIDFKNFECTEARCAFVPPYFNFTSELEQAELVDLEDDELSISYTSQGKERSLHFVSSTNTFAEKVIMADPETFIRENWANGRYRISEGDISNDLLTLEVSYSGCGLHQFDMVITNYFLESNPVQAQAVLPNVSEACRAVFSSTHTFDLNPLKKSYQKGYGEHGIIVIKISEFQEEPFSITYEF